MPERGPEPSRRRSLAIFISDAGQHVVGAGQLDHRVVRRQRLELVLGRREGQAGQRLQLVGERLVEALGGVEAGADGGAALRQRIEPRQAGLHPVDAEADLRGIAGEFLAERDRRRILQMRAADLDDLGEFLALRFQRLRADARAPAAARSWICRTAAMCIAVGKLSLEDWP